MSPKYPLISVITPSYNQGQFIRETIESVLSQDYPAIEYIVVDGGSSDGTVNILQEYGDRIIWISELDEGQADAVNKGVRLAKGEFIGWLNSDDIYEPGALSTVIETFQKNPDISVVYGEAWHITISGQIIARYPIESFNYRRLAETCYICQPAAFIRTNSFLEAGLLRTDLQLCMDYEFWIRLGHEKSFLYTSKVLASSRLYPENKTFSRTDEVFREVMTMVSQYYGYVPITWVYGYLQNRTRGKWSFQFPVQVLITFIRMNRSCVLGALQYCVTLFIPYRNNGRLTVDLISLIKKSRTMDDLRKEL